MQKRCICASLHPVLSHAPRDNSNWVKAGSAAEGDFYVNGLCRTAAATTDVSHIYMFYMYPIISHIADRNRIILLSHQKANMSLSFALI